MSKFNNFKNYNPDILETIANLSNDEVFTPPKLANEILDLLPKEVWSDSKITFLDPAVKTGIFLREIASRLIDGLAEEIPDLQERVNHILTKQVFGIGITELTTLMARRTVYCSTTANGPFSIVTKFDDEKGNIILPDTEHTWNKNGRCEYCGANEENYSGGTERESYAYPFIHDNFEKEFGNMKFDVIIGNPPYQLSDGGNGASANAIYNLFIDTARNLNPKYITMITPSRWMSRSAAGISDKWIDSILNDERFEIIHDFKDASNIFKGVGINGGVNYFLWNSKHTGDCSFFEHSSNNEILNQYVGPLNMKDSNIIIRDLSAISIIEKIEKEDDNKKYFSDSKNNFSSLVSPTEFFGKLRASWKDYSLKETKEKSVMFYISKSVNEVDLAWIEDSDITRNKNVVNKHKVYIPAAYGGPSSPQVLSQPRYGPPNSACSGTYIVIGYNKNFTKDEAFNIISYIKTKLFRYLVSVRKNTQHGTRRVYQFVPLQDFSKSWTDEELYKKYKLTQEEIDYIEETIAPMPASDD